jgi:hypothetical protein
MDKSLSWPGFVLPGPLPALMFQSMNFLLLRLLLWILFMAAVAHPTRNGDQIHKAVSAEVHIESENVLVSSTSISKPTITPIPAAWEPELKRQDPGSITSCVPLQAYESCSPSCSLDPRATTCSSILLPFCATLPYIYAPGLTSTVLGCAATGTASNSYISPTTSTRITSRASSTHDVSSSSVLPSVLLPSSVQPPGPTSTPTSGSGSAFPTGMFSILFEFFSRHAQISASAES